MCARESLPQFSSTICTHTPFFSRNHLCVFLRTQISVFIRTTLRLTPIFSGRLRLMLEQDDGCYRTGAGHITVRRVVLSEHLIICLISRTREVAAILSVQEENAYRPPCCAGPPDGKACQSGARFCGSVGPDFAHLLRNFTEHFGTLGKPYNGVSTRQVWCAHFLSAMPGATDSQSAQAAGGNV